MRPRPYLEPLPAARHSEWKVFFRFVVVAWLVGHAFVDFVSAVRWVMGEP